MFYHLWLTEGVISPPSTRGCHQFFLCCGEFLKVESCLGIPIPINGFLGDTRAWFFIELQFYFLEFGNKY